MEKEDVGGPRAVVSAADTSPCCSPSRSSPSSLAPPSPSYPPLCTCGLRSFSFRNGYQTRNDYRARRADSEGLTPYGPGESLFPPQTCTSVPTVE
eukprot:756764-Hanusia_phi.AAC.1